MKINIVDVNEAPVISNQARTVDENLNSANVGPRMVATDVDASDVPYTNLKFSLVTSSDSPKFAIGETTGQITTASDADLDHETKGTYVLTIKVTDAGGLSDTATATITVNDVNENPVISKSSFTFSAAENAINGQEVGRVTAEDEDDGDSLTYSVSWTTIPTGGDADDLAIHPTTGRVYVAKDTPSGPSEYMPQLKAYKGTVTVTDDGAGFLAASVPIQVNIIPYNDPPTITGAAFSLEENSREGTLIGYVQGADADTDDTLSYSITQGNFADAFRINTVPGATTGSRRRGEIRVNDDILDFETRSYYDLTVQVSDGELSVTTQVTVNVTDVGENPVIDDSTLTMSTDENPARTGITVGTVRASDVDADDDGELEFSFFGNGNSDGHFTIDESTGVVTIASLDVDRETTSSYSIGVKVTDTYDLTDTATITITINDVNDAPVLADLSVKADENLAAGSTVSSKLRATDQDSADLLSYEMGRDLCWSATVSKAGADYIEYAPVPANTGDADVSIEASLRVRAKQDLIVHLREQDASEGDEDYSDPTGNYYELRIGSASNTKVQLRKCPKFLTSCQALHRVAEENVAGVLNSRQDVELWVAVDDGDILVGTGRSRDADDATTILTYTDSNAFSPTRIGVGAGVSTVHATAVCFENTAFSATGTFAVSSIGDVEIGTSSSPNYEAQRWYGFEVVVSDSGEPEREDRAVVQINVQDVNEKLVWTTSTCRLAPDGDNRKYAACYKVDENTKPSELAAKIGSLAGKAVDPDILDDQTITYTIALDGNANGLQRVFTIDSGSGLIKVA